MNNQKFLLLSRREWSCFCFSISFYFSPIHPLLRVEFGMLEADLLSLPATADPASRQEVGELLTWAQEGLMLFIC